MMTRNKGSYTWTEGLPYLRLIMVNYGNDYE